MLTFFVELVWLHATLQNPTTRQGRMTSLLIGVCFKFVELWGLFNFICLSDDTNMNIIISGIIYLLISYVSHAL